MLYFSLLHKVSRFLEGSLNSWISTAGRRAGTLLWYKHFSCKNLFGRSRTDGDLSYKRCFPQDYVTGKLIQSMPRSFLLLSESVVRAWEFYTGCSVANTKTSPSAARTKPTSAPVSSNGVLLQKQKALFFVFNVCFLRPPSMNCSFSPKNAFGILPVIHGRVQMFFEETWWKCNPLQRLPLFQSEFCIFSVPTPWCTVSLFLSTISLPPSVPLLRGIIVQSFYFFLTLFLSILSLLFLSGFTPSTSSSPDSVPFISLAVPCSPDHYCPLLLTRFFSHKK